MAPGSCCTRRRSRSSCLYRQRRCAGRSETGRCPERSGRHRDLAGSDALQNRLDPHFRQEAPSRFLRRAVPDDRIFAFDGHLRSPCLAVSGRMPCDRALAAVADNGNPEPGRPRDSARHCIRNHLHADSAPAHGQCAGARGSAVRLYDDSANRPPRHADSRSSRPTPVVGRASVEAGRRVQADMSCRIFAPKLAQTAWSRQTRQKPCSARCEVLYQLGFFFTLESVGRGPAPLV